MFWICDYNNVGNTERLYLLPSSMDTAFTTSHPTPPPRVLEVHKKLGGDRDRTADPRGSPDHTTSCSAYKAAEKEQGIQSDGICLPSLHCR